LSSQSFFVFALCERENEEQKGKFLATAGKYQLEEEHRVTRISHNIDDGAAIIVGETLPLHR
jgi:hypothetical protein